MVNAMITMPLLAMAEDKKPEAKNPENEKPEYDASLSQVEFFLFLADSIEVGNTLATPLDIEHYQDTHNSDETHSTQIDVSTVEDQP